MSQIELSVFYSIFFSAKIFIVMKKRLLNQSQKHFENLDRKDIRLNMKEKSTYLLN